MLDCVQFLDFLLKWSFLGRTAGGNSCLVCFKCELFFPTRINAAILLDVQIQPKSWLWKMPIGSATFITFNQHMQLSSLGKDHGMKLQTEAEAYNVLIWY